jgi:hypothetical protein
MKRVFSCNWSSNISSSRRASRSGVNRLLSLNLGTIGRRVQVDETKIKPSEKGLDILAMTSYFDIK